MNRPCSVVALPLAALLLVLATSCQPAAGPAQPTQYISIATGGSGGTFFLIGAGLAKIINRYIPGARASTEATAGGVENVKLVGTKKSQLALAAADAVYEGFHAKGAFKEQYDIRALFGGHATIYQALVLADSPIKSYGDLKGKRIGTGPPGSISEVVHRIIMEAHGLKRGVDYRAEFLSFTEQVAAIKDGTIDAAWIAGGLPTAAAVDLTTSRATRFIPIEEKVLQRLLDENPYYVKTVIPPGTYRGQASPVPTVAVVTIIIVHKDISADLAYALTKAVIEHADELAEIHPSGKEYGPDYATRGVPIPFHAGAERYLKEKGILK